MNRREILEALAVIEELERRNASRSFKGFIPWIKPDYDMQWFHAYIAQKLDEFTLGLHKKMMIFMPPQHGKTELATRLYSPHRLGVRPDDKIAIATYSGTIASNFNRAIQRYMDSERYAAVFPETKLNYSQIFKTNVDGFSRTDKKFEIVNKKGMVKTVGRGGSLTSETVDLGIIDDIFKDRAEARSQVISEAAWDWYLSVFKTRLHNDSQQLFMTTRWDENDVAGRILESEPNEWEIIKFPAIREADICAYDIREEGEALYPSKHSLEKLLSVKNQSEIIFNALYQQNPRAASQLLIYPEVYDIDEFPDTDYKYWGIDFGFTTSKTVIVRICETPDAYFLDECCYEPNVSAEGIKLILEANGYKSGEQVFCDHKPTIVNELRLMRIAASNAIKGEGSVEAGIQHMQKKKIYITKRSVNARREAGDYRWVAINGQITNIPEKKGKEHFWDGARYGTYTHHFQGKRR